MKTRLFLTLFLMFIITFGGISLLNRGQELLAENYFYTDRFQSTEEEFLNGLQQYILNPIDFEKVMDNIDVTSDEINYYRNYYGTLSEQLMNIEAQYRERLDDPEVGEAARAALEEERNSKLEEVKKNFESDDVVKDKIIALKKEALAKYKAEFERNVREFKASYSFFDYSLTDTETSEKVGKQDDEKAAYTRTFTESSPLQAEAVSSIQLGDYTNSPELGYYEMLQVPVEQDERYFTGSISLAKSMLTKAGFNEGYQVFKTEKIVFYLIWAASLAAIFLLATVWSPSWKLFSGLPAIEERFDRLMPDVKIAVSFILAMFALSAIESGVYQVHNVLYEFAVHGGLGNGIEWIFSVAVQFALFSAAVLTAVWAYQSIKSEEEPFKDAFVMKIMRAAQDVFLNRSIGMQMTALLIIIFLGGVGLAGVTLEFGLIVIYAPLFTFVLLPALYIFLRRMGYLNRVMKQTEDMAAGRLASPIKVKGKSPIARHAENLNDLRKGIESSMKEQAKSERLKTELITNVSHDLRTPLTSIITYTDLLKNPDLTEEERAKYVGILDQKSAKLKTLIEDLFDVSKMASGNVEINKRRVDLAQMLQQAAGEHEEDFTAAGLDLRVAIHDQPVYAEVDGQKWWRVVDNLLLNARKYSLEGTRVYVSLRTVSGMAEFSVKNVAKYELGENVEELTERFKRADTSRHTEGSGLGLAIAQSIVDLHGGQLKIEVDGDLFKVIVKIHTV
ncbi:MAG: histidine kinase dimerization/phospho-acceptor domain-containing protein [Lysinibacillus sp.]